MKKLSLSMVLMFTLVLPLCGQASTFGSLSCHAYDYYQQKGGRKFVKIVVSLQSFHAGTYRVKIDRGYEELLPDKSYREKQRHSELDISGTECVQALGADPKVISCVAGDSKSRYFYFGLSRKEHTQILSLMSANPGKVVSSISYAGLAFGKAHKLNEYPDFDTENCIVSP